MAIPRLSYNEDRPKFVGRDVQGIKDLNATMAQKYDLNKSAKIQAEDLLHSMNTLDQDTGILNEATKGFQDELQFVVDNNQFERAGQVIEKAVTNVKRNKQLEQSVSNYAAYQQYSTSLKEDPRGWTEEEISSIIGHSLDRYNGVSLDENGQAVGSFNGYDPGEKINILKEFDEGLKGFASSQGVSMSNVMDALENRTQKYISTKTTEQVNREDILAYLNRYYQNDPRIQKYYETKTKIDSRKGAGELTNRLVNSVDALKMLGPNDMRYAAFLANNPKGEKSNRDISIDFLEWRFERESGQRADVRGLIGIAGLGEREGATEEQVENSNIAKTQIARLVNDLDKNFDFEAAAVKNAFTKEEVKHNFFKDDMLLYQLKKLNDDKGFMFDNLVGSGYSEGEKYSGNNAEEILNSEISNGTAVVDVFKKQADNTLALARQSGMYNDETGWNESSPDYQHYIRQKQSESIATAELNIKKAYNEAARASAESKLESTEYSPEAIEKSAELLRQEYISKINELPAIIADENSKESIGYIREEAADKYYAKELNYYKEELAKLDESGAVEYVNNFGLSNRNPRNPSLPGVVGTVRDRNDLMANYKQEYFNNNAIRTDTPRVVTVNEHSPEGIRNSMDYLTEQYSLNNSQFIVRDAEQRIIEDPNDRPNFGRVTGISVGKFSDGRTYYQMVSQLSDEDGNLLDEKASRKGPGVKTYFITTTNPTFENKLGSMLAVNESKVAQEAGYRLAVPLNYRFNTEKLSLANTFVPIENNNGTVLGDVEVSSSVDINNNPDFSNMLIHYKPTKEAIKAYAALTDSEIPTTFTNKFNFEIVLDDINNALLNK